MIINIQNEIFYFILGLIVAFVIMMFFGARMNKAKVDPEEFIDWEDKKGE